MPQRADPHERVAPGTRLVIVRHGEAVSNAEDTIGGHESCLGLTEHGREQVEALASRLRATGELEGAAALYSSILPRAVQTAEVLSPALGGLPPDKTCSLCERHPGAADGMTWAAFEERYGRPVPGVDDDRVRVEGEETLTGFLDRASEALVSVMERHPGELAVVAGHGGLVAASVIRFLGLPANGAGFRHYVDNASLTEWRWTGGRWCLVRYNDSAHLDPGCYGSERDLRLPTPDWVGSEPPSPRSAGRATAGAARPAGRRGRSTAGR